LKIRKTARPSNACGSITILTSIWGPEHSHLVRDEWVDRFAFAGTAEQVRERVREILGLGVDELTIIPFGKSKARVVTMFADGVIGSL
jgi:alkanesulfonate monooxygenase SsuD/methylene tetrahydromethanopterin reductase-like flavin-dependent oxidoreductase (luciferase family)